MMGQRRGVELAKSLWEAEQRSRHEALTSRHFKDLMLEHGHQSNLEKLDYLLLMDRFDIDGDGLVNYLEFMRMMTPN